VFLEIEDDCRRAVELEQTCAKFGWPGLTIIPTGNGAKDFCTKMTGVVNYRYVAMEFDSRQELYYSGGRNALVNSFCILDDVGIDHGIEVRPGAVGGMAEQKDYESFVVPVGKMHIFCPLKTEIEMVLHSIDTIAPGQGALASERIAKFNELMLLPLDYAWLESAIRRRCYDRVPDPTGTDFRTVMTLVAQCVLRSKGTRIKPLPQRVTLIRELVEAQFARNCFVGMDLEDVAKEISTSARSLQLSCKETADIGPMDLLRNVRLEQARRLLTDKLASEAWTTETSLKATCGNIFKFYGLGGKAGLAYKELFGVTPKQDQKDSLN